MRWCPRSGMSRVGSVASAALRANVLGDPQSLPPLASRRCVAGRRFEALIAAAAMETWHVARCFLRRTGIASSWQRSDSGCGGARGYIVTGLLERAEEELRRAKRGGAYLDQLGRQRRARGNGKGDRAEVSAGGKQAIEAAPTVITAAVLWDMRHAPTRWAVPGILPEGVCILAGKPKVGKSWLALDLALAVGAGRARPRQDPGRVRTRALPGIGRYGPAPDEAVADPVPRGAPLVRRVHDGVPEAGDGR